MKVYKELMKQHIDMKLNNPGRFQYKIGKKIGYRPTVGRFSKHDISSENGRRLIDSAVGKNMIVDSTGTRFPHKEIHKETWTNPDGNTHNQIDHILIDKRHASSIIDVRSYRGANCDSDHFMVKGKYRQKITRMKRKNEGSMITKN